MNRNFCIDVEKYFLFVSLDATLEQNSIQILKTDIYAVVIVFPYMAHSL